MLKICGVYSCDQSMTFQPWINTYYIILKKINKNKYLIYSLESFNILVSNQQIQNNINANLIHHYMSGLDFMEINEENIYSKIDGYIGTIDEESSRLLIKFWENN